jgi:hypothetical protein
VVLTATVASASPGSGTPTGSVEFFNGSTDLGSATLNNSGVATLSTTSLTQGSDSITATYQGDTNFTQSTAPAVTVTVELPSATSLTASPPTFTSGQTITLTATVAAGSGTTLTPTGTVDFLNGSTSLGSASLSSSGSAVLTVSTLTATSTLTAEYAGDANFAVSTSAGVTVSLGQSSTTTLTIAPNPSVVGQTVTLAAAVTAGTSVPTGTIMFLNGSIPLGEVALDSTGSALLTLTTLPAGSDSITAQYSGDDYSVASTSTAVVQTVNQASSSTTLSASSQAATAGQPVTLSVNVAAVSPGGIIPTGTVTFTSGTATLGTASLDGNGNAMLVTSDLPSGASTITAQYSGDSNYTGSSSAAVSVTVSGSVAPTQTATTVTLSVSNTNPGAYTSVQFTANVAPTQAGGATPTGTVLFSADGVIIGSATLDANGNATFSTSDLEVGGETITADYEGDSNYPASAAGPVSIAVGTADQVFVNEIYLAVLDRPAEHAGLQDWTTQLADGMSRSKLITLIANSPEAQALAHQVEASSQSDAPHHYLTPDSSYAYKAQRINTMYEDVLGRPADPTGLQFYIGVIDQGFHAKQVILDLMSSDEFYQRFTGQSPS